MGTIQQMINKLDNLIVNVESLSNVEIPVIPDENGMIEKQCPNPNCNAIFKINAEDWKNILRDEQVFCPVCGKDSLAKSFFTEEQVNLIKGHVNDLIKGSFENEYYSQSSNISFHTSSEPSVHLICGDCNVRFAADFASPFCPNCGKTV